MTVDSVSTFLAVSSLLIGAGVLALTLIWMAAAYSERARRGVDAVVASVGDQGLRLAWLMAAVATMGSLYYSQVAHFVPCELCWYQRIAMYPLVVVLGIAAFRGDRAIRRYVLPIAVVGGLISSYHYLIQRYPDLSAGTCSAGVPCTAAYVWKFDAVSIPFMALVSFGVIVATLALDRRHERDQTAHSPVETLEEMR